MDKEILDAWPWIPQGHEYTKGHGAVEGQLHTVENGAFESAKEKNKASALANWDEEDFFKEEEVVEEVEEATWRIYVLHSQVSNTYKCS